MPAFVCLCVYLLICVCTDTQKACTREWIHTRVHIMHSSKDTWICTRMQKARIKPSYSLRTHAHTQTDHMYTHVQKARTKPFCRVWARASAAFLRCSFLSCLSRTALKASVCMRVCVCVYVCVGICMYVCV
jgi:hypothetical protein